jgi:hypothetical protein
VQFDDAIGEDPRPEFPSEFRLHEFLGSVRDHTIHPAAWLAFLHTF